MNINEQLETFLADLGVEMEQPEQFNESSLPEISIFQSSRDHYGVFYRLDIIDHLPQLRITVPVETGQVKMEVYLVRFAEHMSLNSMFLDVASYEGSAAFEAAREASLQHLLYAVAEMMKLLFWAGDMASMSFPPEIEVCRLI